MARLRVKLPEKFEFFTEIRVRIGDINYGGHLGNDSMISLIHEARLRFLIKNGFTESDIDGAGMIMADLAIQYRAEAFYDEVLIFELATDDFSKHGCDIFYRITNKDTGKEVARVKTGIVFFDYQKRKIVEVPEKFKSIFAGRS